MKTWRDAALKRGYKSSIALPFVIDNNVVGSLTLYTSEKDFFKADEIKLLEGVVSNIAYALNSIETEQIRRQAEETIIRKMEELQRFHQLTVGREFTMINLKKEVNALLKQSGKEEKYLIRE